MNEIHYSNGTVKYRTYTYKRLAHSAAGNYESLGWRGPSVVKVIIHPLELKGEPYEYQPRERT